MKKIASQAVCVFEHFSETTKCVVIGACALIRTNTVYAVSLGSGVSSKWLTIVILDLGRRRKNPMTHT